MADDAVVITGIGIFSQLGDTPDACFDALLAGRSAIGTVRDELRGGIGLPVAGLLERFDPAATVGKRAVKRVPATGVLALEAARRARADAKLDEQAAKPERIATIIGSAFGGLEQAYNAFESFSKDGFRGVTPFHLPGMISNMPAGMVSIEAGAKGPSYGISGGTVASALSICRAVQLLRGGRVDVALVGGVEFIAHRFLLAALARQGRTWSTETGPATACRPFDRTRCGTVASEGAVMLVLETLANARRRQARIYAEVAGCGEARARSEAPQAVRESMAAAMLQALRVARASASAVSYVHASGDGDRFGDLHEAAAINQVFSREAGDVDVSSDKGAVGHLLGAAGAFGAAMTALALQRRAIPHTVNLRDPDSDCALQHVIDAPRACRGDTALSNCFSVGGVQTSIALRASE